MVSLFTPLSSSLPPPQTFPDPFRQTQPHPLAREAAEALQARFRTGWFAPGFSTSLADRLEGGKMFGVLVVRALDGRVGFLQAFSGQLGKDWDVPGYVPPLFDRSRREALDRLSDVSVNQLTAKVDALAKERASSSFEGEPLRRLERRHAAALRLRRYVSRESMRRIYDTYALTSFAGRTSTLRSLFLPRAPSWGTGDCAAPKLFAYALREGLRPLALAEFWWGPAPRGGGRVQGEFYPPCEAKCRPVLSFMLDVPGYFGAV